MGIIEALATTSNRCIYCLPTLKFTVTGGKYSHGSNVEMRTSMAPLHCSIDFCVLSTGTGNAQSPSLFQCQQQSGQAFIPSIPDFYFIPTNAASFISTNLTQTAGERNAYIFTIPAQSAERICTGTIVAVQYCYDSNGIQDDIHVFDLLTVTRSDTSFTITSSLSVKTNPQFDMCTSGTSPICCDRFDIAPRDQIQLTSSSLIYGMVNRNNFVLPLTFRNSATEFNVAQFSAQPYGDLNPGRQFNGQLRNQRSHLLLRLVIGIQIFSSH